MFVSFLVGQRGIIGIDRLLDLRPFLLPANRLQNSFQNGGDRRGTAERVKFFASRSVCLALMHTTTRLGAYLASDRAASSAVS
jgi:hypothetical protein